MLLIYGKCSRNSRDAAIMLIPPSHPYFQKLEKALVDYGSFIIKVPAQQQYHVNESFNEVKNQILLYVYLQPRSSVKHISNEISGIKKFGL